MSGPRSLDIAVANSLSRRISGALELTCDRAAATRARARSVGYSVGQPLFYRLFIKHNQRLIQQSWLRGWDSNPRYPCEYAAFRVRCLQPLDHLSEAALNYPLAPWHRKKFFVGSRRVDMTSRAWASRKQAEDRACRSAVMIGCIDRRQRCREYRYALAGRRAQTGCDRQDHARQATSAGMTSFAVGIHPSTRSGAC